MTPEEVWAVLPIKSFAGAKQRLATAHPPEVRQRLAATMVEDVLDALSRARLGGILVVTVDPAAQALARDYGAHICADEGATDGHTAAVMAGARVLIAHGVAAMLAVPGDIPGITPAEVATLIAQHPPAPAFSITPAHDRRGSNAILASPPDAVPLSYGDDSFLPHLHAARARGLSPRIVTLEGIGLDVDHPVYLVALTAKPWATRTHRLLAGLVPMNAS